MKTHAKALLVPDSVPVSSVRRARAATTLRSLVVALAAATLGACSMIPVFERPAAPVPATFPQATPTAAPVVAPLADTIAWRDYFADQRLREVIALALENNRDLRVAALNIERARAVRHPAGGPVPVDRGQRRAECAARAGRPEHDG